jgi:hypothetical protein
MYEPGFLDVPTLLERSQPRARPNWFWFASGAFILIVLASTYLANQGGPMAHLVNVFSALAMIGLIAGMGLYTWMTVRSARAEHQQLEAIEELIQLRRWPQAASAVEGMLSRPTRTLGARIQGLVYLSSVLSRYNRFEDAIAVHNYLLDNVQMDGGSAHALRLGRAMAMLREDHLVDADRAIAQMRRELRTASTDEEVQVGEGVESAGLALVELYRDVKTGHPAEAVEAFEKNLPLLRRQLAHRCGDAWALVAKAYDMLGRESDARSAYVNATLLTDRLELERRFPETASLAGKFAPSEVPV